MNYSTQDEPSLLERFAFHGKSNDRDILVYVAIFTLFVAKSDSTDGNLSLRHSRKWDSWVPGLCLVSKKAVPVPRMAFKRCGLGLGLGFGLAV